MLIATNDPGSLDNLIDIVDPAPISLWWPPAPGWWVVIGILLAGCGWMLIRWVRQRRMNAYRREAIRELDRIDELKMIPILLKRVALVAYPRTMVAPLAGDDWIQFLNESAPIAHFNGDLGERLQSLSCRSITSTDSLRSSLSISARHWILTHYPYARLGDISAQTTGGGG
jgi:Domain of unknown function (DUF4381)